MTLLTRTVVLDFYKDPSVGQRRNTVIHERIPTTSEFGPNYTFAYMSASQKSSKHSSELNDRFFRVSSPYWQRHLHSAFSECDP